MCRPRFSNESVSGSTSVSLPIPARAAMKAMAPPPLPQPTKATCLGNSRSASRGFRANTRSIMLLSSFDGVTSGLLDLESIGIHNLDFHRPAIEPLASEVDRINIDSPVAALHHPRNELVRV